MSINYTVMNIVRLILNVRNKCRLNVTTGKPLLKCFMTRNRTKRKKRIGRKRVSFGFPYYKSTVPEGKSICN